MIKILKQNLKEFKTFAIKGNVIDMAVGIIIGVSFGKIIDSLVKDIIMPPLGWMMGKADFTNLYLTLPDYNGKITKYPTLEAAQNAGAVTINYGIFINTLISFIIITFAVFIIVKAINKFRTKEEKITTKLCPKCFTDIDIRAIKCPNCTADI